MVQKRLLNVYAIISFLLIIGMVILAEAADIVTFEGTDKTKEGALLTLTGKLTKPQGNGPFPAIVLLHGCRGIVKFNDDWAERFSKWGYVALQVDNFGPRGLSEACGNPNLAPFIVRTQDAYDAKAYLGRLPFVDRTRIAVMGWSQGGITTLCTVSNINYNIWAASARTNLSRKQEDPFRAAIAFYPYCDGKLEDTNAPLLILVGDQDTWCPAAMCQTNMPKGKTTNEVILKIYPGAYHLFDKEGENGMTLGNRLLYNPEAHADSIIQVREFLAKHMK